MAIRIHPHAMQRIRERGATVAEVRLTVAQRRESPAKFGRKRFRRVVLFNSTLLGKHYSHKQIDAFAATIGRDHLVVTVIVKYF
jgi:hypothetical protein